MNGGIVFSFLVTAAGVLSCGGPKKAPVQARLQSIIAISFQGHGRGLISQTTFFIMKLVLLLKELNFYIFTNENIRVVLS